RPVFTLQGTLPVSPSTVPALLLRSYFDGMLQLGASGAGLTGVSRGRIKLIVKFCIVAVAIAAILFAQLGPADWQLRTGLGWETEHVVAYFVVASITCLVWPRPFVVGPAFMSASPLLEAMQALTPDRHADFEAGLLWRRRSPVGGSA